MRENRRKLLLSKTNNNFAAHSQPVEYESPGIPGFAAIRHAAAVLFFICFSLVYTSRAFSFPIFGPGMEPRIARLVNNHADRFPLPAGWTAASWRYTDFDIFIRLEKQPAGEALLRLACSSLPSKSNLIGESRNFRIELVSFSGAGEKEAAQAGRAMAERLKNNDEPMFFDLPGMQKREGIYEYFFRKYLFIPLLAAAAAFSVILFVVAFREIKTYLLPSTRAGAALLVLLVAAGALLRFTIAPGTPTHSGGHGVREMRAVLYPESTEQKEIMYGTVYLTAMRTLSGAAGGGDMSVFLINRIFGTLAILSMFMMARALLFSEAAALTAAAAVCLSPGLVWLSGSESPASAYLFLAVAGFAFTAAAAKNRSVPLLWLACVYICLGSTMRLLTMLSAPVAALIFAYSSLSPVETEPAKRRNFYRAAFYCAALAGVWLLFHILSLDPDNAGKGMSRISAHAYLVNMSELNILFDPTLTPACLPVFAAAGFVFALLKRPPLAVLAAAAFIITVPASFTAIADRNNFLHYQFQAHWIYFFLAGALSGYIAELHVPKPIALAGALAIPAAIIVYSIPGLQFLSKGNEEIAEYHFIEAEAARLKPGTRIVLPAHEKKLGAEFPDYLGKFQLVRNGANAGREDVVYLGLDCYRYANPGDMKIASAAGGMRRECSSVCGGRRVPLAEKTLDAYAPASVYHRRYFTLGSRKPTVGFYKCADNAR